MQGQALGQLDALNYRIIDTGLSISEVELPADLEHPAVERARRPQPGARGRPGVVENVVFTVYGQLLFKAL